MIGNNAEKWVLALRSGEYSQTYGTLHRLESLDSRLPAGYCVFGVACDLYCKENKKMNRKVSEERNIESFNDEVFRMPNKVRKWLELRTYTGELSSSPVLNLSLLNDGLGWTGDKTFDELADIIEAEADILFKKSKRK